MKERQEKVKASQESNRGDMLDALTAVRSLWQSMVGGDALFNKVESSRFAGFIEGSAYPVPTHEVGTYRRSWAGSTRGYLL
jgi:hypothetical protein